MGETMGAVNARDRDTIRLRDPAFRRSYRVFTLGCRLNQFDSASIEAELRRRGFTPAADEDPAAVVVVNTCAVTENADRDARRLARRARRENPDCRLLVTGCYAELDRVRLESMGEIDAVVGHADRARIPGWLDAIVGEAGQGRAVSPDVPAESGEIACIEAASSPAPAHFGEHTRAYLKVQEGCDLRCSYCIIPRLRGRSRSVAPEVLEAAVSLLVLRGFREIVLTGVNTGDYGKDLDPALDLASLLGRLLEVPGLGRLRLSSLEPRTVSEGIVRLLKEDPRLARHLQVPLQSGSDVTLQRMRRNYRTDEYRRVMETLRREVPEIGLGADVIVGFPGETDLDFEETARFIESSPLNYLHVFSYSDRPGTPASAMNGHNPAPSIRERSARLRFLGAELGLAFRRRFMGRTLPALVLRERRPDGRFRALTDNFIDLGIQADATLVNSIVPAAIVSATAGDTLAEIVPLAAETLRPG